MQTDTMQNRMAQDGTKLCVCAEDAKRLRSPLISVLKHNGVIALLPATAIRFMEVAEPCSRLMLISCPICSVASWLGGAMLRPEGVA
jgi:hypothetical protein